MPYFKLPSQRKYEYEPAIGQLKFNRENLDSDSQQVFDVLQEIGVKTSRTQASCRGCIYV